MPILHSWKVRLGETKTWGAEKKGDGERMGKEEGGETVDRMQNKYIYLRIQVFHGLEQFDIW